MTRITDAHTNTETRKYNQVNQYSCGVSRIFSLILLRTIIPTYVGKINWHIYTIKRNIAEYNTNYSLRFM